MDSPTKLKIKEILYLALAERIGLLLKTSDSRAPQFIARVKRELKDPALNDLYVKQTRLGIAVYNRKIHVPQNRLIPKSIQDL